MSDLEPRHWLFRVGNGDHFIASSPKHIWGVLSENGPGTHFKNTVRQGDILWFVKTGGMLIGVATFITNQKRNLGPLVAVTLTNEELGWIHADGNWDLEIHYKDLYDISGLELNSRIKSPMTIRKYNSEKCQVNLPEEYANIVKYSKVIKK